MPKSRLANNFHHAHDAYLNVVAGDILSREYSNVFKIYEAKMNREESKTFNMENTLERYLKKIDSNNIKYSEKVNNFETPYNFKNVNYFFKYFFKCI